eukprot:SAG31_NODE_1395_length_8516_cov_4.162885_5_plen_1018_part_00
MNEAVVRINGEIAAPGESLEIPVKDKSEVLITRTNCSGIPKTYRIKVDLRLIEETEEVMDCLRRVPALQQLTEEQRRTLTGQMAVKHYQGGAVIVAENSKCGAYYIIREGDVTVQRQEEKVCVLHKGNDFGLVALQDSESVQHNSFIARGHVCCLMLTMAQVNALAAQSVSRIAQLWKERSHKDKEMYDPDSELTAIDLNGYELHPPFERHITDYMVNVPSNSNRLLTITPRVRKSVIRIQRTVPIIVLCYGGGPQTMKTLVAAGDKPIIIVAGSGRCAQFVEDWVKVERQKDSLKRQSGNAAAEETLTRHQKEAAETCIRRDFAKINRKNFVDVRLQSKKPDWWDVGAFIEYLTHLGVHQQLSFFDIARISEGKMSAKQRLNPMLPILTSSVFKSSTVKDYVKLPLAIRLRDKTEVSRLLSKDIAMNRKSLTELSGNSRLLIYAAYHDLGSIVDTLLECGFDESQLDQLIMLEVERELSMRRLEGNHPDWYQPPGADEEEKDLLWRNMSVEEQRKICRRITWNMLPDLQGRSFDITSNAEQQEMIGRRLIQRAVSVRYEADTGAKICERRFVYAMQEGTKEEEKREEVVAIQARYTGISSLREGKLTEQMRGENINVHFEQETQQSVSIKPVTLDDTSVRLPLDGKDRNAECKFRISRRKLDLVFDLYRVWLSDKNVDTSDDDFRSIDLTQTSELHGLHRLYWAIHSNRPKLARVFMHRHENPLVAGFFCAHCYKQLPAQMAAKVLAEKHLPKNVAKEAEQYCLDILSDLDIQEEHAVFEQYIYWSTEQQRHSDYARFVPKKSDQQRNYLVRSALSAMGFDRNDNITHLDLAIESDSRLFMGHPMVAAFLHRLWISPSDNGRFCDSLIPSSARQKWAISLVAHIGFLIMHMGYIATLPARGEELEHTTIEVLFWMWGVAFVLYEAFHFSQETSIRVYLSGSGNKNDVAINVLLVFGLFARVMVSTSLVWVDVMFATISIAFIFSAWRLLHIGMVYKPLGVCCIFAQKQYTRSLLSF